MDSTDHVKSTAHVRMRHPTTNKSVAFPGGDIPRGTLQSILQKVANSVGITIEQVKETLFPKGPPPHE